MGEFINMIPTSVKWIVGKNRLELRSSRTFAGGKESYAAFFYDIVSQEGNIGIGKHQLVEAGFPRRIGVTGQEEEVSYYTLQGLRKASFADGICVWYTWTWTTRDTSKQGSEFGFSTQD